MKQAYFTSSELAFDIICNFEAILILVILATLS